MPVEDFNGTKLFEGLQKTIDSGNITTELFQNNADFFAWIMIMVAFVGILLLGFTIVTYLGMKILKGR